MHASETIDLGVFNEALDAELTDSLEQSVPAIAVGVVELHERLSNETVERVQDRFAG